MDFNTKEVEQNQPENLTESYKEEKQSHKTDIKLPFEVKEGEEYFIESVGKVRRKPIYSFIKRTVDFLVSFISLAVLLLPFIIIGIIIKCSSKGPIFYTQERLGKNGKPFKLIKFRTMIVDAEKNGAQWSGGENDDRIYKFGRFMRKTRIDELPQLFNCLFGSMSLIGPRPERQCFYNEFEKYIHGFSERLKVKPGITGLAQVNGGYDLKPQEKVLFDIEYIKKRSVWLDIKILFKTIAVVFTHDGAK